MPLPNTTALRASWSSRALLLGLAAALAACAPEPRRPNVLLVSIDMLRADHVGCYGYARPTTPMIDRLAREGTRFADHVSSSSWTLPAHAAIFTSLPDALHGATDTDKALAPEARLLVERFQEAGYETAGFFAGPYLHPAFGFGQGFERYENCTSYAAELDGKPSSTWSMDRKVMQESHADVTNPTVLAKFTSWFQGRSERPFFAFVHLWDAHFDFVPPPPWDTRFDPGYQGKVDGRGFFFDESIAPGMAQRDLDHLIALYDGEIGWTDEHVGRLCALLAGAGQLDDTIVVITSDHGTEFFEHGRKGHRQTLYDEVLRVPFVLRFPGRVPAGGVVNAQTRSIDLGPTLLELAGLPPAADVVGESLLPAMTPNTAYRPPRAVCELDSVGIHLRAVRTGKWKFIDRVQAGDPLYFDLVKDPGERAPSSDLGSELGKRSSQAYLEEVQALDAWYGRNPPRVLRTELPEDVQRGLRANGYVGDDDAPTAEPPRKE
ncbi:MAG: sulfatase [Planctomycetes bacterium]|nr:sulfatase [Planctomycetota bacterium]